MTPREHHGFVVLMPVYEDRESARTLMRNLATEFGRDCRVVISEDGSVSDPVQASDIESAGLSGEVLYLARNMGHQRAIATGLTHIATTMPPSTVIVMDSDGEDVPSAIPALLKELARGNYDAVVARRARRTEHLGFRLFYTFYRFVFYVLTGRAIRFGNFTVLSPRAVRRLCAMQELWLHLASSLVVSRLRIGFVPTDRGKRYHGRSRMNFVGLALHGMRSMMVFAEDVLVRIVLFCSFIACASVLLLGTTTTLKFLGFATPGWFSTLSGILIVILFQAGILTFVTLMVAGAMRATTPPGADQLKLLVERIERAEAPSEGTAAQLTSAE
jgi:hypothetical protein